MPIVPIDEDGAFDLADEAKWLPVAEDDDINAPPVSTAPPLTDPAPALLNTHEVDWDTFERLVLRMARALDGAYDVRRYGKSGQGQHGIDLVGFFTDKRPSVYQSKRWTKFRASDLQAAVKRYTTGRRPFDAERIVVAIASEARDTAIIEKLCTLRAANPLVKIEIWDRAEISERLRDQPRIVAIFFGTATAERFCGVAASASPPAVGPVSTDAILRGPIAHLGLTDALRAAEAATADRPEQAAESFADIAGQLESSAFASHAARLREQQANALTAAGHIVDSALVRIDLGWRLIEAGDPFAARAQVQKIAECQRDVSEQIVRIANALSSAAGFRHDYSVTLDHMATAFDELHEGDLHHAKAGLLLAEEAVAARRPDIVTARSEILLTIANKLPSTEGGQLIAARLRMCIADASGEWESLAISARRSYPPRIAALVLARHARHLTLRLRPEGSMERWLDAIERACVERLYDDAADWLYGLRTTRMQYGFLDNDLNDLHRQAQALRASGGGSILPEPYRARERALANLRDEKWPDALEALRRYLWRSTIGADWEGEVEAHGRLGDLFTHTGRPAEAARHYICAGSGGKLEALAGKLKDEPLRLPTDLLSNAPWEREAAFGFAAAVADLMVNEDGAAWCSLALQEIANSAGRAPKLFAPNPALAAFKTVGQLGMLSTEAEAKTFLGIGRELVPRAAGHYRFTDKFHASALVGIARGHPSLRREAVEQLLQAVLVDQQMADIAFAKAADLFSAERELVQRYLSKPAEGGHFHAAIGLIVAGADTSPVTAVARGRFTAATAPRAHTPGVQRFGTGLPTTALLVSTLPADDQVSFARAVLALAADTREPAANRQEALLGLIHVAENLPHHVREELFGLVLAFAQGREEGGEVDDLFGSRMDPLQRFRIDLGPTSLAPAGLQAAAALAFTGGQYTAVQREATRLMLDADETTCNAIARAMSFLPAPAIRLDLDLLASHMSPWFRALAAVIWTQLPENHPDLGARLARDKSKHVRGSLASNLGENPFHAEARGILVCDPRRSVRTQVA